MPRFEPRFDDDCPVCAPYGVECKGGGNKLCRKRDPKPARIALILDQYGNTRTVVGTQESIKANTGPGEWTHLVPKLVVHTPIAWNDIPIVIERAKLEFDRWLEMRPNLSEDMHHAVVLYRLRCLRHVDSRETLDVNAMVWT